MHMTVRKANPTDAESLYDLYYNYLNPNQSAMTHDMAEWRRKIAGFGNTPGYYLLVGEASGRVVSTVTLIITENLTRDLRPYGLIENVVTHGDFRGRGYARQLMNRAKAVAMEVGCYKIMLLTGSKDEGIFTFYENCGYNRTDKTGFVTWISP
jgi:GNAT superfamily N-acetyltransferase